MNDSDPIVSIVTPTFNHEPYIRRCLESAISQTDPRWEQIVVDDGSDDATEAVVRSLKDPRIQYVRRSHRGIMYLAEAYNIALEMSRGTFIAVLEGDDFWPTDKIERQLPLFDSPDVVLSWGRAYLSDEFNEVRGTFPGTRLVARMQGRTSGETLRSLLKLNFIPACTVMCRRDALVSIGGFQQPAAIPTADFATWLELCRVGRFAAATAILGCYRLHGRQVTARMRPEMDLVLDWGTRFVERLSEGERDALGVSLADAYRIKRIRHAYLEYGVGRAALRENHLPAARSLFWRALRKGSATTRLKAGFSLFCLYLGLDLDRMAMLANRVRGR
jgi:glycosyltransferase involved in cell wall biosynthesis